MIQITKVFFIGENFQFCQNCCLSKERFLKGPYPNCQLLHRPNLISSKNVPFEAHLIYHLVFVQYFYVALILKRDFICPEMMLSEKRMLFDLNIVTSRFLDISEQAL